jgi:hypothetical protein
MAQSIAGQVQGMTHEQMAAEIARLKGENEALTKAKTTGTSLKVSTKGALSVYGLGRWPVTLYRSQWERLLSMVEGPTGIKAFIAAHSDQLTEKGE